MKILIATTNPGKFKGILDALGSFQAEFVSLADLGIQQDFEEVGDSFYEIALAKARFYHRISGLPTVADDSGIIVEALAGELGLKTRRWGAGAQASDEEWLRVFMDRMKDEANRNAEFVCAAAYVFGDIERAFEGRTAGVITATVEAPLHAGIPLSSVFKPEGYDKVYMALSSEEKNAASHRAKAFSKLLSFLQNA